MRGLPKNLSELAGLGGRLLWGKRPGPHQPLERSGDQRERLMGKAASLQTCSGPG